MIENSKLVFITHPYFAVNNPTNNYKIYKKKKNSSKWTVIKCKNKEDYRKKIKEYIGGFYDYSRDEEKSHTSVKDYINDNDSSLFDYFMGGKKEEEIMEHNKMKREEMAMLKTGDYLLDKDVNAMRKRWCNYIENSNIQMTVLSFNQDYIDNNISVKELQKKIAIDVMPKFLSYCGYEDPKKNLEWVVALHSDRENNYHFHISWIEKNKSYRNRDNKLGYRVRLTLSDEEINFLKRQSTLTVERKKLYTPTLIELEKDLEDLKSYFNPKDRNFTLRNIKDLEFEEKIIKLGFLLNQVRSTDKKYIKYNSLPRNEIGKDIRKLTKEIKKELFNYKDIKNSEDKIYKTIEKINDILIDIDRRNNISNIGFESALDNVMIKSKLEKNENYVYNSIVNHALYNFEYQKKRIKKNNFTLEDLITQLAYDTFVSEYKSKNIKKIKFVKVNLIRNSFKVKSYKSKFMYALERLGYEQDEIAKKFYEMFEENSYEK